MVLFLQEEKTVLLMPKGVLSECSVLMGRVGVVARREKKKHIIYRVLIFHATMFRSDGE